MILKMFGVYDVKAAAYLPPFFIVHVNLAKRTFSDCVNDPKHPFGMHPEDYSLHELGMFDDTTGRVESYENPQPLGPGNLYISEKKGYTLGEDIERFKPER